jgi:N-formylglutamate deformylase
VERVLQGLGFSVKRNDPYAGGFITRHYGRPREGVHAVQIEIVRSLYMDEARIEKLPRFDALRQTLTRAAAAMAARLGALKLA